MAGREEPEKPAGHLDEQGGSVDGAVDDQRVDAALEEGPDLPERIEAAVLAPFRKIGTFLWRGFDSLVIDGVINASAFLVELTGDLLRFFTTGNVRNYALSFTLGVLALAIYVFLR